jgi:CDP-diacylglycerol--serine O-phosphatidyltransferase
MNLKKHIPNAITCANLFCGCLAILYAFQGHLIWTCYLVGIGALLDFLDGFAARLLNVKSEIGKQLDSLADMVTFGVVPGVVMYFMLLKSTSGSAGETFLKSENAEMFPSWLLFSGFLITIFSALRLAKFNVDTRQTDSFIGLPTPANTLFICSLPLIMHFQPQIGAYNILEYILNPWFLLGITITSCYVMVAEIPLLSFKFKNFSWGDNKLRYILLLSAVTLLVVFQFVALPFVILLYILLSFVNNP